jgi:hypothetical protein
VTQTYNDLAKAEKPLHKELPAICSVVVIGCGGTGSQLIPDLVRAFKFGNNVYDGTDITLVDGDFVESKNIERQNFISRDIGKNKAEVLAKRYGQVFGIPVKFLDKNLTNVYEIKRLFERSDHGYRSHRDGYLSLIITCADNHYLRKNVHRAISSLDQHILWIDSGNEDTFGQVVCGFQPAYSRLVDPYRSGTVDTNTSKRENIINKWFSGQLNNMSMGQYPVPNICEIFPEILEATAPDEDAASCADVAEDKPQNILINRLAATAIMSYVYPCFYAEDIIGEDDVVRHTNTLSHYMTLFNINGEFTKKIMKLSEFKDIFSKAYEQLSLL